MEDLPRVSGEARAEVGWEVVEGSGREGGSLEVFILFRSEILS